MSDGILSLGLIAMDIIVHIGPWLAIAWLFGQMPEDNEIVRL